MEQSDSDTKKLSMGEYSDRTSPEVQKIKDQWMQYEFVVNYLLINKGANGIKI